MLKEKLLALIKTGKIDDIKTIITENIDSATLVLDGQRTLIHYAARQGYLKLIQFLLEKKSDLLNLADSSGQTPVFWASAYGHADIVEYLATLGADLNLANTKNTSKNYGYAPIHWAVKRGHQTATQVLTNHGADINIRVGEIQFHSIHIAAMYGHLDVVKILLNKNPELINITDKFGQTPLLLAAVNGHTNILDYLISEGSDINQATNRPGPEDHGKTALHWATECGHTNAVRLLIQSGANITTLDGIHPIHIAAKNGHLDLVKLYLDNNPKLLNLKGAYGQTPLIWAAIEHADIIEYLISKGAELNNATTLPDDEGHGKTALHWATECGHTNAVRFLMQAGAAITTLNGIHPIHIAAEKGHLDLVKLYIDQHPDFLDLADELDQTPLLWAAANGHADIVEFLISEGTNLNQTTHQPGYKFHGRTALDYAMENNDYDTANLLILKITAHQPKKAILPFIKSGTQALELMTREPTMLSILLKDQRIMELIHTKTRCSITGNYIDWYKPSDRRPSWFAHINTETKTSSVFKPVTALGEGHFGAVRLFQSTEGQTIAVKSLTRDILTSSSDYDQERKMLQREARFNKTAYPEDGLVTTFEFHDGISNKQTYNNRQIMPYVEGDVVKVFLANLVCPEQLAESILSIIQDLHRLHSTCQIIHGDIHSPNILMRHENNRFIARFIDFGLSHYIYRKDRLKRKPTKYGTSFYAPETFSETSIAPHINQDIYSLGFLLKSILNIHPTHQKLALLFPSIKSFITSALSINPLERPSSGSFCQQLSYELSLKAENNNNSETSALIKNSLLSNAQEEENLVKRPHLNSGEGAMHR